MSVGLIVSFQRTAGDPRELRKLTTALVPANLFPIVGRSAMNTIREHLFGLNASRPNKMGGKRTMFYADAARGTSSTVLPDGALVSINQVGIRQRFFGGTIRPKNAKWLTIPARAEAHGKRAREFNDLRFIVLKGSGGAALIRNESTTLKRKRDRKTGAVSFVAGESRGGEVMFWLRKSVTQRPDPTVLPYDELINARIDRDVTSYVTRRLANPITQPSAPIQGL